MNIIIVGCGRVGAELARLMSLDGATVTVIDREPDAFSRLDDSLNVQKIVGDGADIETLKRAGIEEADGFAAVTNGDNRNIMAAQIAQRMFNVNHVVCRIYDPLRQRTYKQLGLHSISPTVIGAKLLRDTLKGTLPGKGGEIGANSSATNPSPAISGLPNQASAPAQPAQPVSSNSASPHS